MTVVGDTSLESVIAEVGSEVNNNDTNGANAAETPDSGVFADIMSDTEAPHGEGYEEIEDASKLPTGTASTEHSSSIEINRESYSHDDLVITADEKAAFIDAMVTGERYYQTFSIFNGKITVTVRSRTTDETHALYAYVRHMLGEQGKGLSIVEGDMAYVTLVAQVEEINGVKFPEMRAPLMFEEIGGAVHEPGWLADFKAWKAKPEGLTSAILNRVQLFEYKYWTMVKEANNRNFWNSDTSIA